MPWAASSDWDSQGSIRHFSLRLNEQLKSMLGTVVEQYAFAGRMAVFLLATSQLGEMKDGQYSYHPYTPHHMEFSQSIEYPTQSVAGAQMARRTIDGFAFECHLKLLEFSEMACDAFEQGLEAISSTLPDRRSGYWHHTRSRDAADGNVFPETSTYIFQRQIKHVFRVTWNTSEYPPREITVFTYPDRDHDYLGWPTKVPITTPLSEPNENARVFLQGMLKRNVEDKGKGRA
ncbi:hypothetical protein FB451DRAFT_1553167 [Mycena latifolia]|nr:hypothetical protein FB451DRAFT_1553167 [Mycena latifolia]